MRHRLCGFSILGCVLLMAARGAAADAPARSIDQRGVRIAVAADAPAPVQAAAKAIAAAAKSSPLLAAMAGKRDVVSVDSAQLAKGPPGDRAFDHVILVGLPDDPMIRLAWQRDARPIQADGLSGFYVFGFGNLLGDIGYIESDRNPFLHAADISRAPYETEVVTITGSTPQAVELAAAAFVKGLANGVVAGPGWKRGETTLLDHDPLRPNALAPAVLPAATGDWKLIALTQPGEDEYRGVLAAANVEPLEIWRAKYYRPGAWDEGGFASAMAMYSAGLHRRSYGNTLWAARFADERAARAAAPLIAKAAGLKASGATWTGAQPPFGFEKQSSGDLAAWQRGAWVFMSTLPAGANGGLQK